MPRTRVYTLRPYWNLDGSFIDPPGDKPGFDPAHPSIYPGLEVRCTRTLSHGDFVAFCEGVNLDDIPMYSIVHPDGARGGAQIALWELTGRTSADVLAAAR